jgi:2-dehydro-3-deoxyphosphogluconate aldolase/(4S)-4-hydroxy-2-oxoglutarate aldolase
MRDKNEALLAILKLQPVVPVLVIEDAATAVPLARALVKGGLKAIEITLRTPAALDAIRAVADGVEGAVAGAGTILNAAQYQQAVDAGSQFIVSPGTTQELLDVAKRSPVPLLPGAATASEVMALREEGYRVLKFFPAEQAGGAAYLKSLSSPLAGTLFCPTGGIFHLQRPRLPLAAECRVRRRLLGGAEGACRPWRLGRHHPSCRRGDEARRIAAGLLFETTRRPSYLAS